MGYDYINFANLHTNVIQSCIHTEYNVNIKLQFIKVAKTYDASIKAKFAKLIIDESTEMIPTTEISVVVHSDGKLEKLFSSYLYYLCTY